MLLILISGESLNVYELSLNSLGEQITRRELENLINIREKWQWLGYALLPFLLERNGGFARKPTHDDGNVWFHWS